MRNAPLAEFAPKHLSRRITCCAFSRQRRDGRSAARRGGGTAGPGQFLKTIQAPPLLRTSRHTASASCRVSRPMRAVYRGLAPKARLRSFWISGFSLFNGPGRERTVDRKSLTATGFWKCPASCAPHGAQVPSAPNSAGLRRRVSAVRCRPPQKISARRGADRSP